MIRPDRAGNNRAQEAVTLQPRHDARYPYFAPHAKALPRPKSALPTAALFVGIADRGAVRGDRLLALCLRRVVIRPEHVELGPADAPISVHANVVIHIASQQQERVLRASAVGHEIE